MRVNYVIQPDGSGNPIGVPTCPACGYKMYTVYDECPDCGEPLDWSADAITELARMLHQAGIPYEMRKLYDGWQICYPKCDKCKGDVVKHCYSYGHDLNQLEAYGFHLPKNDVAGYLTAQEAFEFFDSQYKDNLVVIFNRFF